MQNAMTAAGAIETYIAAKDSNRPELMKAAFAENCDLTMKVRTDAISFPSSVHGLADVTDVLVTNFGDQYENVRTFCLSPAPRERLSHFRCVWLVGMIARAERSVRVGCGRYDWNFAADGDGRVESLTIEIDIMNVFAPSHAPAIMSWLAGLDYPWCPAARAIATSPAMDGLQPIRAYLAAAE